MLRRLDLRAEASRQQFDGEEKRSRQGSLSLRVTANPTAGSAMSFSIDPNRRDLCQCD
jgi:hypothetical protein